MVSVRGTGRTTKMLIEAYEYRESATEELPILVYAASFRDAERLVKMFCDLAQARGSAVARVNKLRVVLDGEQHFEFRGFSNEEDSPAGKNYAHILVDHYAWEAITWYPNDPRPETVEEPSAPLMRLWKFLKEKLG